MKSAVVVTPDTVVLPKWQPLEVEVPETPIEAQILELGADIIEIEGWARGGYSVFGRRCAVGGIGAAMQRLKFMPGKKAAARRRAESELADLIRESSWHDPRWPNSDKEEITAFNDRSEMTKEQVVRKMREAAARLTPKF